MSEKYSEHHHEQAFNPEHESNPKTIEQHIPRLELERQQKDKLEQARATADRINQVTTKPELPTQYEKHPHHYVTKKLRDESFKKTMSEVQQAMTPQQRLLSNIIHQPELERLSDVGSKTIARPFGLIGGGLFGLIGGSITYLISKTYGFELPRSLLLFMFLVGFLAGITFEATFRLILKRKIRRSNIHKQ